MFQNGPGLMNRSVDGLSMRFDRRIQALERRLVFEPVTLFFADGSSTQICGRRDYVLNLFAAACRGEHSPQLELIARRVRSQEPGGGQMMDLARALLNGPVEQSGT
jgi:hypothetical protein